MLLSAPRSNNIMVLYFILIKELGIDNYDKFINSETHNVIYGEEIQKRLSRLCDRMIWYTGLEIRSSKVGCY